MTCVGFELNESIMPGEGVAAILGSDLMSEVRGNLNACSYKKRVVEMLFLG